MSGAIAAATKRLRENSVADGEPAEIEEELRRQKDARERDRQPEILRAQLAQVAARSARGVNHSSSDDAGDAPPAS